jgi:hypothetical protein
VIENPRRKLIETVFMPIAKFFGDLGISYMWVVLAFFVVILLLAKGRIKDLRKQSLDFIIGIVAVMFFALVALVLASLDQLGVLRGVTIYRGVAQ